MKHIFHLLFFACSYIIYILSEAEFYADSNRTNHFSTQAELTELWGFLFNCHKKYIVYVWGIMIMCNVLIQSEYVNTILKYHEYHATSLVTKLSFAPFSCLPSTANTCFNKWFLCVSSVWWDSAFLSGPLLCCLFCWPSSDGTCSALVSITTDSESFTFLSQVTVSTSVPHPTIIHSCD